MMLAGDEIGRTQRGNNNAYCQDNELSWVSWNLTPRAAISARFRRVRSSPIGTPIRSCGGGISSKGAGCWPGVKDITWFDPNGEEMTAASWGDAERRTLGMRLFGIETGRTRRARRAVRRGRAVRPVPRQRYADDLRAAAVFPDAHWALLLDTAAAWPRQPIDGDRRPYHAIYASAGGVPLAGTKRGASAPGATDRVVARPSRSGTRPSATALLRLSIAMTRRPGSAPDPLWYKDALIYQVHVRTFFDSNGDGIGDFPGLTAKLDYIQRLGVSCIWLLPFYPVTVEGRRLRHRALRRGQPALRHAARLQDVPARGARARAAGDHRAGDQSHLRSACVVPGARARRRPTRASATTTSGATRPNATTACASSSRTPSTRTGRGTTRRRPTTGIASSRISPI